MSVGKYIYFCNIILCTHFIYFVLLFSSINIKQGWNCPLSCQSLGTRQRKVRPVSLQYPVRKLHYLQHLYTANVCTLSCRKKQLSWSIYLIREPIRADCNCTVRIISHMVIRIARRGAAIGRKYLVDIVVEDDKINIHVIC